VQCYKYVIVAVSIIICVLWLEVDIDFYKVTDFYWHVS